MYINKVVLIGTAGKEPVVNNLPNGSTVAKFSIALNSSKQGQTTTTWANIVAWNEWADYVAQNVQPGASVEVYGRLQTETWTDRQSGQTRSATKVVASYVNLVAPPHSQNGNNNYQSYQQQTPQRGARRQYANARPAAAQPSQPGRSPYEAFDEPSESGAPF